MSEKCAGCKARDKRIESYKIQLKQTGQKFARLRKKTSNINQGLEFEELVLKLIKGAKQAPPGGHCDIITRTGKEVEVKLSELNSPNGTTCKRWDWESLYGYKGKNKWDYLILGGRKDPRFKKIYKDKRSPYVYFLLDWNATKRVKHPGIKVGHIAATTYVENMRKNNNRGRLLWEYETSQKEITRILS